MIQPVALKSRFGNFRVLSRPDLISSSIKRYGEWAQGEIDIMSRFIDPGDTVLDVGAYIGTHSRAFSSFVGARGRVISFEPQAEIFSILEENATLAPHKNIMPLRMALGQSEGVAELFVHDTSNLGATSIAVQEGTTAPSLADPKRVAMKPIDALGIEGVCFIKVDAEGFEVEILKGAVQTILRDKPVVAMEVNTIDASHRIFDYARNVGYRCFGYAPLAYNSRNFNGELEDIHIPGALECGILLIADTSAEKIDIASHQLGLAELTTVDDIVLLLLQKPQYPFEVLMKSCSATVLSVPLINAENGKRQASKECWCRLEEERKFVSDQLQALQSNTQARENALVDLRNVLNGIGDQVFALSQSLANMQLISKEREYQLEEEMKLVSFQLKALRCGGQARENALADLHTVLKGIEDQVSALSKPHVLIRKWRRLQESLRRTGKNKPVQEEVRIHSGSADPKSHMNIEHALCIGQELSVRGWFFHEDNRTVGGEITLEASRFSQKFRVRTGRERGDVASDWKNVNAARSGFVVTCLLDPRAGKTNTAEISFTLENDSPPAVYRFTVNHIPHRRMRVLRHVLRRLNGRRLKIGFLDIVHGRLDTLWLRMNHLFQHRHRLKSIRPNNTNLRHALSLISAEEPRVPSLTKPVDIIIPVYNGLQYLDPLFESLEKNTPAMHRVIVIDDCSSDERVRDRLKAFADSRDGVTLILLGQNQGFAGAVNRATKAAESDFVLLNTDVIVPPNWLDRLFAPIAADPMVASVTPFSNAATICSFPEFCADNPLYGNLATEQIDRWFERVRVKRIEKDLPSGVGFCMAINRAAWQKIGAFDEIAFRRGYGEENDWCQRAQANGYRNIIAPNLFAYHKHGGSFESTTRAELRKTSLTEVARRFPTYLSDVAAYCKRDPLRPLREILSIVVACREASQPSCLIIDHKIGGGANQYRDRIVGELVANGSPVLSLLINNGADPTIGDNLFQLEFSFGELREVLDVGDVEEVQDLINIASIKTIVVNETVSFDAPLDLVDFLVGLKATSAAKLVVPIHDFYALCPSYTLLSNAGEYCGLPEEAVCASCLPSNRFARNPTACTIECWRDHWRKLLSVADEILCFSEDSRKKVIRTYPQVAPRILVRPHAVNTPFDRSPRLKPNGALHIGVVGAIGPHKGALVVNALAREMQKLDRNARITVIGEIHKPVRLANFRVTGRYEPRQLPNLLEREGINICLFPSIWPETFSYVTEELTTLGVPLAVFDLGAPSERVRNYGLGRVLDLSLSQEPTKLYEALTAFKEEIDQRTAER
jgi:FkbM family methyltransferase